jgi:hypothetical protein
MKKIVFFMMALAVSLSTMAEDHVMAATKAKGERLKAKVHRRL